MTIRQQVANLRNEIGKPSPVKGRKVKQIAIRFQQHFLDREFTSQEFADWMEPEPGMSGYASNHSMARDRLDAAGHRDDMVVPFEIVRVAKSIWKIRPPERLLLSGDLSQELGKFIEKQERRIISALQACDIEGKPESMQKDLLLVYNQFKAAKGHLQLSAGSMQESITTFNELGYSEGFSTNGNLLKE